MSEETPVATTDFAQWLSQLEADVGRLREQGRRASMILGPSLPLQEIEAATAALRERVRAGRALAPAQAAAEGPAPADPPAVRAMLDREDQARRLATALETALGQLLANAVVELSYSEPLLETDPAAVRAGIEQLKGELQEGLERLRWIVSDLRAPSLLNEMGLGPSLTRYAARFAAHAGVTVVAPTLENFTVRLPASVELAVFRVVQEALDNAGRHAGAQHIEVGVAPSADGWTFFVEDDGRGVEALLPAKSLGLLDMQARSRAVGGVLRVSRRAGGGTRVTLSVAGLRSP